MLPQNLWVKTIETKDLIYPFLDEPKLINLWDKALRAEDCVNFYLEAYTAVKNQEREFPKELNLRLTIGECYISNDILHYRDRIWLHNYEPLTTAIIQTVHDSYLSGHPGRDAKIPFVS